MKVVSLNDQTIICELENKDEETILKKFLTYDDNSAAFSRGGYDITKVKKAKLYKIIKEKYLVTYAGMTREIVQECKEKGIKINDFVDKRTHFKYQKEEFDYKQFLPNFDYTEHQERIIDAMKKTNKGIVKAATSAGKSLAMIGFMKMTKLPTLILTDRATLGKQLSDNINKAGIDCGFYGDGKSIDGFCVVSTIQSSKKLPNLSHFKCLIVDECHKASSKSFQDFFKSVSYPLMFGFSASPFNGDYLKFANIRQFLGPIIVDVGANELVDNGVMSKPHIKLVKVDCMETFDYPSAYDLGIVKNESRNKIIKMIADSYEDGVAIIVNHLEHGEKLEEMIEGSVFIRGATSLNDRIRLMKEFDEGKIKCLIGSSILNEGISIDNIKHLIIAGGQKATTVTTQRIGRALRLSKAKNKTEADVYDFIDNGNKFLLKHSKQRIKIYKSDIGFEIEQIITPSELGL